MNLKKTLYNINLGKEKFFNLRSGGLNWDVIKKNLVFIMNYKKYDWANNRLIDEIGKERIRNIWKYGDNVYIMVGVWKLYFILGDYTENKDFQL